MIARVRIAPKEYWCEWHDTSKILPGQEVEIIAESCAIDPPSLDLCGHAPGKRWWLVTEKTVMKYQADRNRRWICESMLEMD